MQISKQKQDKIAEQILSFLYHTYPDAQFTSKTANEIIRDEEFTLNLLKELESKGLVVSIKQNPKGKLYTKRKRWRLSNQAYEAYKQHQTS